MYYQPVSARLSYFYFNDYLKNKNDTYYYSAKVRKEI